MTINGVSIGSEAVLTNDPTNVVEIVGAIGWAPSVEVTLWHNATAYSGNDLDDIKLTQMGECEPPCETVVNGARPAVIAQPGCRKSGFTSIVHVRESSQLPDRPPWNCSLSGIKS